MIFAIMVVSNDKKCLTIRTLESSSQVMHVQHPYLPAPTLGRYMPSVINKGHFPLPFYIVKNEKHAQSTQATRGPRKSITLDETKNVINFTLCDAPIQPTAGPNSPHTPRPQEICLKMLQDKETKAINKRTKKIL